MAGQEPSEDFLGRNLYFHYPHYRSTMPHTAMISGSRKVLHFWGHADVPILFDLSSDIGEVSNIAEQQPAVHKKLFVEMMNYLKDVGGRIPKMNPDYDPIKYQADKDYWYRVDWGPLEGKRQLDDAEREPFRKLGKKAANVGDTPMVRFANLTDGAHFPAKTDLQVEVDETDGDGMER
jgi:arylsulfatase A